MSKTTIDRKVLERAIEALRWGAGFDKRQKSRVALRDALETNSETVSAMAQPQQEIAHWQPVELTDGHGNQITLIQAIDHAITAAEATGSGRLRTILLAAKQALAQPQQEPVAIHQWRKPLCCDWYDGHPDNGDGGGPYETRTLYRSPPASTATSEDVRLARG